MVCQRQQSSIKCTYFKYSSKYRHRLFFPHFPNNAERQAGQAGNLFLKKCHVRPQRKALWYTSFGVILRVC